MKPYFQQDGIAVYHGDALEVIETLPVSDLLILDPPFFMPAQHYAARSEWRRAWGDTEILRRWWSGALELLTPRLKTSGSLFTFCDDESYSVFYPDCYTRFTHLSALVWNKGRIGMGRPWRHAHEFILHARNKFSKWRGSGAESDVLDFPPIASKLRFHPVSKPPSLLAKLIQVTTDEDDLVIDPFMGGGSTLYAAKMIGRRAIGVEIEERYCEVAANQLSQGMLELNDASEQSA